MTKKSVFIFIGGLMTGIVLTVIVLFAIARAQINRDLILFEQPQETIEAESLIVRQVLQDGSALATAEDFDRYSIWGMTVMIKAKKGTAYYDEQTISIPSGKCLKQIGTYRYTTSRGMEKTVPVVEIFDKQ